MQVDRGQPFYLSSLGNVRSSQSTRYLGVPSLDARTNCLLQGLADALLYPVREISQGSPSKCRMPHDSSGSDPSDFVMEPMGDGIRITRDNVLWLIFGMMLVFVVAATLWLVLG